MKLERRKSRKTRKKKNKYHCRGWIGNKIAKISDRFEISILFKLKSNANFYRYKE